VLFGQNVIICFNRLQVLAPKKNFVKPLAFTARRPAKERFLDRNFTEGRSSSSCAPSSNVKVTEKDWGGSDNTSTEQNRNNKSYITNGPNKSYFLPNSFFKIFFYVVNFVDHIKIIFWSLPLIYELGWILSWMNFVKFWSRIVCYEGFN
jgi:hypothetical protein